MRVVLVVAALATGFHSASAQLGQSFVNFETPHVHPLELTPNGERLLAVNTAAGRLEVFSTTSGQLVRLRSIPVGVDPVSVRARLDTEAWVVNHVSDSVSIVDLTTGRVRATLETDDEPADVVFAGDPLRAFVTCSQANTVQVFDPADVDAPPVTLGVDAEDPRALAVSPDGGTVYAAMFESGNGSTVLMGRGSQSVVPPNVVGHESGPWGGQNPPPNDGNGFTPPQAAGNPPAPGVSLIVKKDDAGAWMDDNGGDWTELVSGALSHLSGRPQGWDVLDHDIVVIDADTLAIGYVDRLMNLGMALGVDPVTGTVALVGTDAINEVRYEPNLNGRFLRVNLALAGVGRAPSVIDLNPHLAYDVATVPQPQRDLSIGDPRGIAWAPDGSRAFVTGMGSNNVVAVDAAGARLDLADVGEGPTGVVVDDAGQRLYILNKFEASISVLTPQPLAEIERVPFPDPTPAAIRGGRKHLYDTHATSGLGHVACASCHVDGRMDRLAWDLGDPAGAVKPVAGQNLLADLPFLQPFEGDFKDFHPMKGPMVTQTFQDIVGKEPFHWRGDRDGLEEFNAAFPSLQGDDELLTATELQEFEDFLATLHFPPNPFRELDNSLPTALDLAGHVDTGLFGAVGEPLPPGDAQNGLALFLSPTLDLGSVTLSCFTCHTLPTGMGTNTTFDGNVLAPFPAGPNGEQHHMLVPITKTTLKVPHLRNLYERVGFETTLAASRSGFGFEHDGNTTLSELLGRMFSPGTLQDLSDVVAFTLAFSGSDLPQGAPDTLTLPPGTASQDAHAAVGRQLTARGAIDGASPDGQLLDAFLALADAGAVGLTVHGRPAGLPRGYAYVGAQTFQSDRAAETVTDAALRAEAAAGTRLTYTLVPFGSETRLGVDRDGDGALDRDELDHGSDPGDSASVPAGCALPGVDLGYGTAGAHGVVPTFRGCGTLTSATTAELRLDGAAPGSVAIIVISPTAAMVPFAGGTLVPAPDALIGPVAVDGLGSHVIPAVPGGGGPVDLYVQWIVLDPGAPYGRVLSNAMVLSIGP